MASAFSPGIAAAAPSGGAEESAARPAQINLRIVIAENDAIIAMDLAELLADMGHEICAIARSEAEAVIAAAQFAPDLMIVDGGLDSGSGVAAMRRILAERAVAHVYVTGSPQAVMAQAPGAIVVAKPFSLEDLRRGITAACAAAGYQLRAIG